MPTSIWPTGSFVPRADVTDIKLLSYGEEFSMYNAFTLPIWNPNMNRLTEIGFIKVGFWQIIDGSLKYHLDDRFTDVKNNLYAFVCDGEVKYVGESPRII